MDDKLALVPVTAHVATNAPHINRLVTSKHVHNRAFVFAVRTDENGPMFDCLYGPRARLVVWWNKCVHQFVLTGGAAAGRRLRCRACRRRVIADADDSSTLLQHMGFLLHMPSDTCKSCGTVGGGFFSCCRCHSVTCRACVLKVHKIAPVRHSRFRFRCPECDNEADMVWM